MSGQNQFLLYTAPNGAVKVDVFLQDETVWLTQKALAELFGVQRPAITKHLGNIFSSGELVEDSVCSILEHTAGDGKTYSAKYYNLDAIIAVGYRVNSYQATQFRIWATKTLREFILKGFVLDDARLKQGQQVFGKDYRPVNAKAGGWSPAFRLLRGRLKPELQPRVLAWRGHD